MTHLHHPACNWCARAVRIILVLQPLAIHAAEDPSAGGAVLEQVIVTARLRQEDAQEVPIALSVVDEATLKSTGTVNVAGLTQLVPSLNYVSPNPRNTSYTIRGLGSSVVAIAQSNDGLEPGVGFYVDGVYHGRPATAAFDFTDLDRIEVLRGPQGTLFGKNTTSGAISVTTQPATLQPHAEGALTVGNYGELQGQGFVNGALFEDALAGRVSAAYTERRGLIRDVLNGQHLNDLGNLAARGQVRLESLPDLDVRLTGDFSSIQTHCCAQEYVRVGASLKPAARQYPALAAGLGYAPPSLNPYDRLTDIDAPVRVMTNEGGLAANVEWKLPFATLTSITAWRYWNWDAANDRDYTALPIQTLQHIPSRQDQYSEELRLASRDNERLEYVAGLYWFTQTITGEPITQYGPRAAYWLLGPQFPSRLLDGYGTDGNTRFRSDSYAVFGELTWRASSKLSLTGGVRYTYENKNGRYSAPVYGGLATTVPAQVKAKLSILRPQAYTAHVSDGSPTGRIAAAWEWQPGLMSYLSAARGSKSGGINMSGLPLTAANQPALTTAVIKPEENTTVELGIKSRLLGERLQLNADAYETLVQNFQTNVVDTGPGALRGYLANIDRVEVKGLELEGVLAVNSHVSARLSYSYTDGTYRSYRNGPCPLELIAATTTVCNLSGRPITATPRNTVSLGAQYAAPVQLVSQPGSVYARGDMTSRSSMYGDVSDSRYTLIDGYAVLNASIGLRIGEHWDFMLWSHNLLDRQYLLNVTVQAGNSGLIVGTPGDPRTYGLTIRARF